MPKKYKYTKKSIGAIEKITNRNKKIINLINNKNNL